MRSAGPSTQLGLLLGALILVIGACRPPYPACKTDADCNRDKPRNEYCVNQRCQQCRSDGDCPKGRRCNQGRCDAIPDYCENDSTCPAGTSCIDNRCRPCTSDNECGEGGRCRQGKCLRKGQCETDEDCPEDQYCEQGMCTGGARAAAAPRECTLAPVYFDFNEYVLSTEATQSIDKNAACLKRVGRAVRLIGRSDPRGTEEYNFALSERRALQVKDRLKRLGIDEKLLKTLPKGELEATGKDEPGWAQDRRVDFEWM